jgi:integrase
MPANVPVVLAGIPAPMLKAVIDGFLGKYPQDKKSAMFKKHKPVLSMLLEVVGNKPINELKQADINDFFELLERLPPRWADQCRKRKLTVRELAELDFDITLGPKSFDDTYIASIRPFLKSAKKDWQDQGFPLGLTTDGIEYLGDREEGESKQRAFERDELVRLFEGDEMRRFANDSSQHHFYWILHLGLFTGARVNEICQINPQTDILQDEESGAFYLWITKDTEADPRIRKSVKTGDSRKVPIHHKLIELGFLTYVKRTKAGGHKLLFPEWQPINRRASGEAEKWVRQFFLDTKLRDETPKAKILGMHAFRHTLLTYGAKQKPPLSLFCVTGHAQDEAPIHATGAGKGYLTLSLLSSLSDRKELLDRLDYKIALSTPVTA